MHAKEAMSHLREETAPDPLILARIWEEDGVWNISAFDLPIVAYGGDLPSATSNFDEAIQSHFQALADFGRVGETLRHLAELASDQGFWEARVRPRAMVERFTYPLHPAGMQGRAA